MLYLYRLNIGDYLPRVLLWDTIIMIDSSDVTQICNIVLVRLIENPIAFVLVSILVLKLIAHWRTVFVLWGLLFYQDKQIELLCPLLASQPIVGSISPRLQQGHALIVQARILLKELANFVDVVHVIYSIASFHGWPSMHTSHYRRITFIFRELIWWIWSN